MGLRVAIIGCGRSGTRRARTLSALGIEEIICSDREIECARRLAAEVGGTVERSLPVAATSSEATLICTPPSSRLGIALAIARVGGHLFMEAPLSDNLEGLDPLLAEAASSRYVLMVGSRARFHPGLERLRTLLEARAVGRVYAASMWLGTAVGPVGQRVDGLDRAVATDADRGTLLDGVQWLDALRWLFGNAVEVTAVPGGASPQGNTIDQIGAAVVRLENGAVVQLYADALRGPEATRIEVFGTDGTLRWAASDNRIALLRLGGRERREERVPVDEGELDAAELRHFLACVLTGRTPVADGAEGKETLGLALALRRASRLRRTVGLGEHARGLGGRRGLSRVLRLVHAG